MKTRKLTFSEMCSMVSYYDFYDTEMRKENSPPIRGTMYKLDKMLSDEEKKELSKYNNVRLFVSRSQYAPEIKRSCVFLADRCI